MPPDTWTSEPGGTPVGRTLDIAPILDEARWSAFQKLVLLMASLTIVLDGLDTQTLSLALPTITREWGIGREPFGVVLAVSYVAMAIGTVWGGMLGDRFGRRFALLASMVAFGIGTLAGAATGGVLTLGLTRLVASVGIGAAMPNATALVAEYTPRSQRSLGIGIAMGSVPVGAFIGGMLAAFILPHGSWQALFVVCGIIPLVGVVLLAFALPESVRFLMGRPGSEAKVAALLRRIGTHAEPQDRFVDSAESHADQPTARKLFAPEHLRDTLVLSAAFFLVIYANLMLISWVPSLLADLGYAPKITSTAIAVYSIGGLAGAVAGSWLFARIGSRFALSLTTGGGVLFALLMCLAPLGPHGLGAASLVCAMLVGGILIPGSQVLLFSLAGQVYPTTVRSTGVGFAVGVGRIGAVFGGLSGPLLLGFGPPGFFSAAAIAMLGCGAVLLFARTRVPASREVNRAPHLVPLS